MSKMRNNLEKGYVKHHHRRRVALIKNMLCRGGKFLDVGCGDGTVSKNINSEVTIGIDLDIEQLRYAEGHVNNFFGVVADVHKLPFKNSYFDKVLCHHVIEHVKEPQKCIDNIFRVLRDDGTFVIGFPNRCVYTPEHIHSFSDKQIIKMLEFGGFKKAKEVKHIGSRLFFEIAPYRLMESLHALTYKYRFTYFLHAIIGKLFPWISDSVLIKTKK